MADWQILPRHHPGFLDDEGDLEQLQDNLAYIAGLLAAQTAIVGEAPINFRSPLESTHADGLDQVKDIGTIVSDGLFRNTFEYESHAPTSTPLPTESRLKTAIENTTGSNRQLLGDIVFARESENNGLIALVTYLLGAESGLLYVDSQGRVGVLGIPEYTLDVPTGVINVSGDYRRDGVVIADWSEAAGTVSWAGPARVTGTAKSTVATGTAPLVAVSTTECVGVSASQLAGLTWCPPVMASGFAAYTSADTDIATGAVNRVGTWKCTGVASVFVTSADAGKTVECKLKDGSGAQIGETSDFEILTDGAVSVKVTGAYVSAAGNEDVKMTVRVVAGTGDVAEATVTLVWQGP